MLPFTNIVLVFALLGAAVLLVRAYLDYRRVRREIEQEHKQNTDRPLVVVENAEEPVPDGDKIA